MGVGVKEGSTGGRSQPSRGGRQSIRLDRVCLGLGLGLLLGLGLGKEEKRLRSVCCDGTSEQAEQHCYNRMGRSRRGARNVMNKKDEITSGENNNNPKINKGVR